MAHDHAEAPVIVVFEHGPSVNKFTLTIPVYVREVLLFLVYTWGTEHREMT